MRRRFGRRRSGRGGDENGAELDAGRWLERLTETGVTAGASLEPIALEGVAGSAVVLAAAEPDLLLGFSPHDAGDALFGALALAQARAAESGFTGTALAVAPFWSDTARRRLALVRSLPYRLKALAASQLADEPGAVTPASPGRELAVAPEQISASIERAEERALFARVLVGLQGLAAKHGGSVRGVGRRAELVLFARRAACVEAGESGGLRLVIDPPDRTVLELSLETLASALDRLEGSLRKQLSDRRIRTSEEGQRASLLRVLERAAGLRRGVLWPNTASEPARIDWVGVGAGGEAIAASARERLTLATLGEILDASLDAVAQLGAWMPDGPVPLRHGPPRLVLAATQFDAAALHVLGALALQVDGYDVRTRRSGELELERREAPAAPALRAETRPAPSPRPSFERPEPRSEARPEPRVEPRPQPEARPAPRFEHLDAFDGDGEAESAPRFESEAEPED
ncbi:MAG TPA: hypothetical protein VFY49_00475, partial [Myxococcota bacterium]|nr:hypothetical protein [Myxococcota bacterium]